MKTDSAKTDTDLGSLVHDKLVALGVETPMIKNPDAELSGYVRMKLNTLALNVKVMMQTMGLDLTDDSLAETPTRVAKMWVHELMWGLDYANFPKATVVDNKMNYDEMVMVRNIEVMSLCEHHLLKIGGLAHVAYIPGTKVLGLSKVNRIVEFFSRRPQIQERLTAQVFHTLCYVLDTDNVAVCIEAEHDCVKTRGVEDPCSDTVTTKLGGVFRKDTPRQEFMDGILRGKK